MASITPTVNAMRELGLKKFYEFKDDGVIEHYLIKTPSGWRTVSYRTRWEWVFQPEKLTNEGLTFRLTHKTEKKAMVITVPIPNTPEKIKAFEVILYKRGLTKRDINKIRKIMQVITLAREYYFPNEVKENPTRHNDGQGD